MPNPLALIVIILVASTTFFPFITLCSRGPQTVNLLYRHVNLLYRIIYFCLNQLPLYENQNFCVKIKISVWSPQTVKCVNNRLNMKGSSASQVQPSPHSRPTCAVRHGQRKAKERLRSCRPGRVTTHPFLSAGCYVLPSENRTQSEENFRGSSPSRQPPFLIGPCALPSYSWP